MQCPVPRAAYVPDSELRFLASSNHILTADEPAWPLLLAEINRYLVAGVR